MSDILIRDEGGLRRLTLNRPHRRHALTHAMYTQLADALASAEADPAIRVVLLSGSAGHFTGGNDLEEFIQCPPADADAPVLRFLRTLAQFSKPLVAEVRGVAIGIGTTLLMHCDLAYCDSTARFQMPFTALGLCAEGGSTLLLPLMAGPKETNRLLLLGDAFSGAEAQTLGLVNQVLEPDQLSAHVDQVCQRLLTLPPQALRLTKKLLRDVDRARLLEQIDREGEGFIGCLKGPETAEALAAFRDKRAPDGSRGSR